MDERHLRAVFWMGSSLKDLRAMPGDVRDTFGYALHQAQTGGMHSQAKILRGFGSAGTVEVIEDDTGGTYRVVYTVNYPGAVYVLHCFQKKSHRGISTPRRDIALVRERLKAAERHFREVAHG